MYDIGFVVGKYAPLTRGHIMLINQAAVSAKRVVVILSHDQRWVDSQVCRNRQVLGLANRLRWLEQTFAQDNHISIRHIDESNIPQYPNGWKEYTDILGKLIDSEKGDNTEASVAIFSSEIDYDPQYKQYLPQVDHVVVDSERTQMPISATMVRNSLYANWEYLPSIVRMDYTRRIVVLGTESTGKTTLVRALAKYFNTSWVEEYGRTYVETVLCGKSELLRSSDFELIAYRHKELEEQAKRTANRVCFIDTNAFITEFYHRLFIGEPNPVVSAIAAREMYDVVLLMDDNVPWVDDGMRVHSDRKVSRNLLGEMYKEFPNQVGTWPICITGDTFEERYKQAIRGITEYLDLYSAPDTLPTT